MSLAPNRTRALLTAVFLAAAAGVFALAVYGLMVRARVTPAHVVSRPLLERPPGGVPSSGVVSGVVQQPDGTPQRARVTLIAVADSLRPQAVGRGRGYGPVRGSTSITSEADGSFKLSYVAAGKYWLVAHAEVIGDPPALPTHFWGIREVSSDGRGEVTAQVQLALGATVSGRMTARTSPGGAAPDFSAFSLSLVPVDSATMAQSSTGNPRATLDAMGGFVIPAVPPGRYRLEAALGSRWLIDTAEVEGRDAVDVPIDVASKAGSTRAAVVLTDRPNELSGTVRDAAGRPAGLALVMAFAANPAGWNSMRRTKAIRAGADGQFHLTGLPAGEYLVSTAGDLTPQQWYTADGYRQIAARAVRVVLGGGATQGVTLQIR